MSEKRQFLLEFDEFNEHQGKCHFELIDGQECQGWIYEIQETNFVFLDNGLLACHEPLIFAIEDLNIHSFSYWNENRKKWIEYPET